MKTTKTSKNGHHQEQEPLIKRQGMQTMPLHLPTITARMISTGAEDEGDLDRSILIRGEAPVPTRPIERDMTPYELAILYQMQDQFLIPEYQRDDEAWSYPDKARYILMFLYNIDVCKIRCFQYLMADGTTKKAISDGQQQFTAIIEFMNNKFPLPTQRMLHARNPNMPIPVLEPGCYYRYDERFPKRKVISPALRQLFNSYRIDVSTMRNVPRSWEPYIFEAYQQGKPLSLGDRLWARPSHMNTLAKRLLAHPLWHEVYELRREEDMGGHVVYTPIGKPDKDGKVDDPDRTWYVAALEMLIFEAHTHPAYMTMRKEMLMSWASGDHDTQATAELYQAVWESMNNIARVFRGADATSRTDAILMKQAEMHLRQTFTLTQSEQGCLVQWFRTLKKVQLFDNMSGGRTAYSIVAHMQDKWGQEQVWEREERHLMGQLGLVRHDQVTEAYRADLATSGRM